MAIVLNTQGLASALATEFGAAVEAVLGQVLVVAPGAPSAGPGWGTPITATGVLSGTLTVYLDLAGVRAVAMQMMNLEEEPEAPVVIDMLRELWGQAAAATALKDGFDGLTLAAGLPVEGAVPPGASGWAVRDGATTLATLSVAGQVAVATAPARPAGGDAAPSLETPSNLAALLDIDLPLVVRFARTELSLRALTMLGPGSMVDMGRSPDDPVQLLVGTQVIAEGEVVVVAGNYGVRITSLVSPAERLKAMEL